jgi:hypothetical protein
MLPPVETKNGNDDEEAWKQARVRIGFHTMADIGFLCPVFEDVMSHPLASPLKNIKATH